MVRETRLGYPESRHQLRDAVLLGGLRRVIQHDRGDQLVVQDQIRLPQAFDGPQRKQSGMPRTGSDQVALDALATVA